MTTITYFLPEILERLSAFFPADEVKSFPLTVKKDNTKGMAAFYVDNRAVQQRLDDTCVWRNEFREDPRSQKSILCGISIYVELSPGVFDWITRWDGADNTDIEATKGGLSGSMRRAAVQWGIGRYLYEVPGQWIEMKPPMGSGKAKYFKTDPRIPAEFLPEAKRAQKASPASTPPPASPKKAKAAKPAGTKLSAAMTKKFSTASEGKDRKLVAAIYERVINGTITASEGLAEVVALEPQAK